MQSKVNIIMFFPSLITFSSGFNIAMRREFKLYTHRLFPFKAMGGVWVGGGALCAGFNSICGGKFVVMFARRQVRLEIHIS